MLPKPLEMLRLLVATPSVSSTSADLDQGNVGVLELLASWLEELKFSVELQSLPGKCGKANLIARLGGGTGGVAFAGHADTVPCDPSSWLHDPFEMNHDCGRVTGLGVTDMKGFFPLVIEAASEFQAERLKHPVTVIATCDEETSMAGARFLAENLEKPADVAILGEPTDRRPVIAHKGYAVLIISCKGTGGHSSNPLLGKNALEAMHRVLGRLVEFRDLLKTNCRDASFEIPYPTMNFGCLHAGDNPNRICERAHLEIDLRLLPSQDPEAVLSSLDKCAEELTLETGMEVEIGVHTTPVPSFEGHHTGALISTLSDISGHSPETAAFCTEAPFYAQMGMDVVVYGPGSIAQAHRPNEYLDWNASQSTISVLQRLINAFCVST